MAAPKTISLKHTIWDTGENMVYFYEGEAKAVNGVVSLPVDRPEWIRRAWVLGYRLDPKTKKPLALDEIISV